MSRHRKTVLVPSNSAPPGQHAGIAVNPCVAGDEELSSRMALKILYGASFPTQGSSGHHRATRQKLQALRQHVQRLDVVTPGRWSSSSILKAVLVICNEGRLAAKILRNRKKYNWFVSRGLAGFLSLPLAKAMGIATAREVHAVSEEEISIISDRKLGRAMLRIASRIDWLLTRAADVRICNHPLLLEYLNGAELRAEQDFFVYNGAAPAAASGLSRSEARSRLGLNQKATLLCFVGSASAWHGVSYLVQLQAEFNRAGDDVQIICGGGKVSSGDDPCGLLINMTPLGEEGCALLVRASDACLLPVAPIRVSPGSPLKLYDYIMNERRVITQCETLGYSDEVDRLGIGSTTDFKNPRRARADIMSYLTGANQPDAEVFSKAMESVSWERRMWQWIEKLQSINDAAR